MAKWQRGGLQNHQSRVRVPPAPPTGMPMIRESQADEALVAGRGWRIFFDDRYGDGSSSGSGDARTALVTFTRIAADSFSRANRSTIASAPAPDAPHRHQRQQLCREHQMKQRLLEDALFLRFLSTIQSSVPQRRVTLIPCATDSAAHRMSESVGRTIALRRARRSSGSTRLEFGESSIHSPTLRPVSGISSTTSFQ